MFNIIQNLKEESASGLDGISVKILIVIRNHILESSMFIFNACLRHGLLLFPNTFKTAIIKPLYKLGNKDFVLN